MAEALMQSNDRFIRRVFNRFLVPTILSVLGGTVNVLVDNAIVGNLLGPQALAAINLCGPIFLICYTVGTLIGSGAGYLSASLIGQNEEEKNALCYSAAVIAEVVCGAVLTLFGLIFLRPIIGLLGADETLFPLAMQYGRIAFWGSTVKCLLYIPFNFLRLEGKTGIVSASLVAMTVVNGILDVVFIKLGFGMAGASLASVLGTCLAVGIGFWALRGCGYRVGRPSGGGALLRKLLTMGTPSALSNFLETIRLILLNRILIEAGGNLWVAIFTILCSMSDFSLCFISGIPQTASPLVGIYCGEKNNTALRRLMRVQLIYGAVIVLPFALLVALLPGPVCALFGMEASAQAVLALRCFAFSRPFAFIASTMMIFYNASGQVGLANGITVCRVFLFAVIPAVILWKLELPIWYFLPLSEILTLALLWPALRIKAKRNTNLSRFLLLDETLDRRGRVIDFSVSAEPDAITDASEKVTAFCEANQFTSRQTMVVSLSIEEMLVLIQQYCFDGREDGTCDLRVFCVNGVIGLRIRNGGHMFNPLLWYEQQDDPDMEGDTLGLMMISSMAELITYKRTYGFNCLTILLKGDGVQ